MKTNITSHPRFYLMMALLLLLALAACGSGGETPAEAEIAPTEAAVADATPADVAAAEQPSDAPTDAPAAEPTMPPATAEPTAEPTAAPDNPPAAAFGTGDCGNAFYPVVEGRALTFRSNVMGLGETSYTTIYSDVTDSSFTNTTDLGDGQMMVQTWQCTGEGMLSPEFTQMPGGLEGIEIEFTEASGVSIPSEATLRNGGSWTTHYVANADMSAMGAGAMTMQQTIDLENTVVGTEAVTVPAGDFPDAIRVDTAGTMSMIMSTGDTAQPATEITIAYTSWYVEGVGVVRQDFSGLFGDTGAGDNVTELVSVE